MRECAETTPYDIRTIFPQCSLCRGLRCLGRAATMAGRLPGLLGDGLMRIGARTARRVVSVFEEEMKDRRALRKAVIAVLGTEPAEEEVDHYVDVLTAVWDDLVREAGKEAERAAGTDSD